MPCADSSTICARRQVTTDPVPAADDPQQAPPLVIIDIADAYSFCHPNNLATPRRPDQHPNGASRHNTGI
jgi:hypothetical protein